MFKIGKTCSPSAPPVLLETKIITKVKMTCGGGMGGSVWNEYGKFIDPLEPNKIVRFRQYLTGETVHLNTNYIVKSEEKKVVKIESDCTKNSNFSRAMRSQINYWLMARDAQFVLVDEACVDVRDSDAVCIHTINVK